MSHRSGLYKRTHRALNFELRLDIDGNAPQQTVSVSISNRITAHWIADLRPRGTDSWEGPIWFRDQDANMLRVSGRRPNGLRVHWRRRFGRDRVTLIFMSNTRELGGLALTKTSRFFREVEFELDREVGVTFQTDYDLGSHDDRPAGLTGRLTLEDAYANAGIRVRHTAGDNTFSGSASGLNNAWNMTELHDAMQTHWSRADGTPWSLWVMAADHFENEPGFVTFGIMFDAIGQFHRNGTAVFNSSIEDFYPPSTPQRNETIARHKFRTLVHEVGHAFNLAHSWQKEHASGTPWSARLTNEPNALSFMNYPRKVAGGAEAYWQDFRFRFSDQELLFMRHAPEGDVAMAGESWFENHGETILADDEIVGLDNLEHMASDSPVQLVVRFPNRRSVFNYMEPVTAEVRITNTGPETVDVPLGLLDPQNLVIHLTRNGTEPRRIRPYARQCRVAKRGKQLKQGEKDYGAIYLSSSINGWNVTEPGRYDVTVELTVPASDDAPSESTLVSASATFYVRRPTGEDERLAQDVFCDDVGRVLAFGGSKVLTGAVDVIRANVGRIGVLAEAALALPSTRAFKRIGEDRRITTDDPQEAAVTALAEKIVEVGAKVPVQLGHIGFSALTRQLASRSAAMGRRDIATRLHQNLLGVFEDRQVTLPPNVSNDINETLRDLSEEK